ncbi:GYF domain containing protein [Quillaja saponaria]|uniref:GYF domain containing protein n=1 Tax=Quillaja saponaria TaxID=32244 RepID=A0AAD7LGK5_QUISA|nr:GYF domain containing protein [Quillaja saponaria]
MNNSGSWAAAIGVNSSGEITGSDVMACGSRDLLTAEAQAGLLASKLASKLASGSDHLFGIILEERRRDPVGNLAFQGHDIMASSKKNMNFWPTSYSDADLSEASFVDMLKSNGNKAAQADTQATGISDSWNGNQGSRGGKRKGKKTRQLDPTLLGFKVTSNRILMGEIQGIDD